MKDNIVRTWYVVIERYGAREHQSLSRAELEHILQPELAERWSAVKVGRKNRDRLELFCRDAWAFVYYENYESDQRWASYNDARRASRKFVRLSPADAEDFSFTEDMIIAKDEALRSLQSYLDDGFPQGLVPSD